MCENKLVEISRMEAPRVTKVEKNFTNVCGDPLPRIIDARSVNRVSSHGVGDLTVLVNASWNLKQQQQQQKHQQQQHQNYVNPCTFKLDHPKYKPDINSNFSQDKRENFSRYWQHLPPAQQQRRYHADDNNSKCFMSGLNLGGRLNPVIQGDYKTSRDACAKYLGQDYCSFVQRKKYLQNLNDSYPANHIPRIEHPPQFEHTPRLEHSSRLEHTPWLDYSPRIKQSPLITHLSHLERHEDYSKTKRFQHYMTMSKVKQHCVQGWVKNVPPHNTLPGQYNHMQYAHGNNKHVVLNDAPVVSSVPLRYQTPCQIISPRQPEEAGIKLYQRNYQSELQRLRVLADSLSNAQSNIRDFNVKKADNLKNDHPQSPDSGRGSIDDMLNLLAADIDNETEMWVKPSKRDLSPVKQNDDSATRRKMEISSVENDHIKKLNGKPQKNYPRIKYSKPYSSHPNKNSWISSKIKSSKLYKENWTANSEPDTENDMPGDSAEHLSDTDNNSYYDDDDDMSVHSLKIKEECTLDDDDDNDEVVDLTAPNKKLKKYWELESEITCI
ncbi:uncharacterized protein LOC130636354 [Hydractinia symbiolongicarpus]|uniref:uncharacterized protein LOC130636354 n=1 Tax=Hydractinia symbiolongicarpus TaxID=13093 RepID=UPI00254E13E5|nr:uncharacterized protein LOC130636354 [Hydractinia symbiolongicarpus]